MKSTSWWKAEDLRPNLRRERGGADGNLDNSARGWTHYLIYLLHKIAGRVPWKAVVIEQ